MGQIWTPFGVLTLFWGTRKYDGLITMDPDVLYIFNFAGTFCVMMSTM